MSSNGSVKSLLSTVNESVQVDESQADLPGIESDSEIPDEIALELEALAKENQPAQERTEKKRTYLALVSKRFSADDLKEGNPLLFEKFYLHWKQLGIEDNKKSITQFVNDYLKWLEGYKAELAEAARVKNAAKTQKLADMLKGLSPEERESVLSGLK